MAITYSGRMPHAMTTNEPGQVEAIFVSTEAACAMMGGIARSKLFELLRTGELASVRLGKRRLISRASIEEWAERMLAEGR